MPITDYSPLTREPADCGLSLHQVPLQPPLPLIGEPEILPFVGEETDHEALEPLSSVPGVLDLAAYHWAGWPDARPISHARPAALVRLNRAAAMLPPGFGLAVFDAWRPLVLQRAIYDTVYADHDLEPGFVSIPSDSPETPPPHLTGGTFDLTLTWHGQPLALGTAFDEFTPRAHTTALEMDEDVLSRELRRLLVYAMRRVGFVAYHAEWWHFEYGTRRWAAKWLTVPRFGVAEAP